MVRKMCENVGTWMVCVSCTWAIQPFDNKRNRKGAKVPKEGNESSAKTRVEFIYANSRILISNANNFGWLGENPWISRHFCTALFDCCERTTKVELPESPKKYVTKCSSSPEAICWLLMIILIRFCVLLYRLAKTCLEDANGASWVEFFQLFDE